MAGWNLTKGQVDIDKYSDDKMWSLFNYVFSDSSRKRNTYKFGLIKSILDNLYNATECGELYLISYDELFGKFAGNYWNLIVKYKLKQMRRDNKSIYSRVESIFNQAVLEQPVLASIEFDCVDDETKKKLIKKVSQDCRRNVIGALYEDMEGMIYTFDLKGEGIYIPGCVYEFLEKYKYEIEKLNYYSWAKFLETINDDNVLIRLLDKLELATIKRKDLSLYREILRREFEQNTCFYCGRKLKKVVHVDHFIPWSYIKSDNLWNFVLACSDCNIKKNNRIPVERYLNKIILRNDTADLLKDSMVQLEFRNYKEENMRSIWRYAKLAGLKEYNK